MTPFPGREKPSTLRQSLSCGTQLTGATSGWWVMDKHNKKDHKIQILSILES